MDEVKKDDLETLKSRVDFLESYIRLMLVSGCIKHGDDYLFSHYKDENLKKQCMAVFVNYMNNGPEPLSDKAKIINAEIDGGIDSKADYVSKTIN